MTFSVTLHDKEWYEIIVLLRRQLEQMRKESRCPIRDKWIWRYKHMIREIDNSFPTD